MSSSSSQGSAFHVNSSGEDELEKMLMEAERLAAKMRESVSPARKQTIRSINGNNGTTLANVEEEKSVDDILSRTDKILSKLPAASSAASFTSEASTVKTVNCSFIAAPTPVSPPRHNEKRASLMSAFEETKVSDATALSVRSLPPSNRAFMAEQQQQQQRRRQQQLEGQDSIEAAINAAREMELALKALGGVGGGDVSPTNTNGEATPPVMKTPDSAFSPISPVAVSPMEVCDSRTVSDATTEEVETVEQHKEQESFPVPDTGSSVREGKTPPPSAVKWEKIQYASEGDEDYVAVADYSDGSLPPARQTTPSNPTAPSLPLLARGVKPAGAKTASDKPSPSAGRGVGADAGVKFEKIPLASKGDNDYVPVSDYSNSEAASGPKFEKVPLATEGDDDYVPVQDYSNKEKQPSQGSKALVSGLKFEKVSLATEGDDDYVPVSDYSSPSRSNDPSSSRVKFEKVSSAREGDEDYVPIADYSTPTRKLNRNRSSSLDPSGSPSNTWDEAAGSVVDDRRRRLFLRKQSQRRTTLRRAAAAVFFLVGLGGLWLLGIYTHNHQSPVGEDEEVGAVDDDVEEETVCKLESDFEEVFGLHSSFVVEDENDSTGIVLRGWEDDEEESVYSDLHPEQVKSLCQLPFSWFALPHCQEYREVVKANRQRVDNLLQNMLE